jgi:hypothetical protein
MTTDGSNPWRVRKSRATPTQPYENEKAALTLVPVGPEIMAPHPPQERRRRRSFRIFSENFERNFRRVFLYVSRRVNDREILERIVNDVLEENLDILVVQGNAPREVELLRASADRLIAQVKVQLDTDPRYEVSRST